MDIDCVSWFKLVYKQTPVNADRTTRSLIFSSDRRVNETRRLYLLERLRLRAVGLLLADFHY